jgi:hypothetical protein
MGFIFDWPTTGYEIFNTVAGLLVEDVEERGTHNE